jgi:transposase
MRGKDEQQLDVFSYVSPEQRVPQDHPLCSLRAMTDEALRDLQPRFNKLYARTGRPSIAPEKLLRALLLQALYSVRSERLLMEQLDYNLLFRWFVGLNMDDSVWDVTVFTKNRERLLDGDIAEAFFQAVLQQARERSLLSDEHFTVDGTLLEAWASVEELSTQGCQERRTAGRSWQCDGGLSRGEAVEPDARIEDGPGCEDGAQRQGQRSEAELQRESPRGKPQRSDRERRGVRG